MLNIDMRKNFIIGLLLFISYYSYSNSIYLKLHDDGSFDIIGTSVKLENCYPSINNNSIKPLKIEVLKNENIIRYFIKGGCLRLSFRFENKGLILNTEVETGEINASIISPVGKSKILGVKYTYSTPMNMNEPSGLRDWPKSKKERSSSICGFVPSEGTSLIVSTRDYRRFHFYSTFFPLDHSENEKMMSLTFQTEMVDLKSFPAIFFNEYSSSYEGMKNEAIKAAKVMNVDLNKNKSYHWCSWYYSYNFISEKKMYDYIEGFEKLSPRVPIQTIQIDEGYQPHVGDWLFASQNFPKGIEPTIKKILSHKYKAGIWIAPYIVGNESKLYKKNPNWILHYNDGTPVKLWTFYDEKRLWGLEDREYYMLDTSNPDVMNYLRNVFRTFRNMGITFYKTDFMKLGAQPSNLVRRHTPGKTSVEYQRELFEMIRSEIGDESFWLGCISQFAPMVGYVDGMRIAGDISSNWAGTNAMFNQSKGCHHLNDVWWQNDPDAIILRKEYNNLNTEEVKTLALWMGMIGGVTNTSDLFHTIPKDRVDLFRFLEPSLKVSTINHPIIEKKFKTEIFVRNYTRQKSWGVLFVNRSSENIDENYSFRDLLNIDRNQLYHWDWDINRMEKVGLKSNVKVKLKPHESRLIYLSVSDTQPGKINLSGEKTGN